MMFYVIVVTGSCYNSPTIGLCQRNFRFSELKPAILSGFLEKTIEKRLIIAYILCSGNEAIVRNFVKYLIVQVSQIRVQSPNFIWFSVVYRVSAKKVIIFTELTEDIREEMKRTLKKNVLLKRKNWMNKKYC